MRVPWRERLEVTPRDFIRVDVRDKAVLVAYGVERALEQEHVLRQSPVPHGRGRHVPARAGALLVGIDSHNIDDTRTKNSRPVHTILLGAEILIVEHLRGLEQLPLGGIPLQRRAAEVQGVGTFPVARLRVARRSCRLFLINLE